AVARDAAARDHCDAARHRGGEVLAQDRRHSAAKDRAGGVHAAGLDSQRAAAADRSAARKTAGGDDQFAAGDHDGAAGDPAAAKRAANHPAHDLNAAALDDGAARDAADLTVTGVVFAVGESGDELHAAALDGGPAGRAGGDEDFHATALDDRSDGQAGRT